MLIVKEAIWFGVLVVFALGLWVTLVKLQNWGAKQREKNKPVRVVTYRNGKSYCFACSTIRDAAGYTLKRLATGESVAYIEADGERVWNSLKGKQSLVELTK